MPTAETDDQRRVREAEERGRRQQVVDGRLDEHDRRLDAINGQLKRGAEATERVEGKVNKLTTTVNTANEVSKALAQQAKDAIDKQVTARQFFVGVAGIIAVVLSALIATGGHL